MGPSEIQIRSHICPPYVFFLFSLSTFDGDCQSHLLELLLMELYICF